MIIRPLISPVVLLRVSSKSFACPEASRNIRPASTLRGARRTVARPVSRRPQPNSNASTSQPGSEASSPSSQPPPPPPSSSFSSSSSQPSPPSSLSSQLAETDSSSNPLLTPVYIPEDANAVLKSRHPATTLLANSSLVVQRQIEMMNIFLGFEQANRYVIMDPQGNHVGYMAEHEGFFGNAISRQMLRTHRPFVTNVFDRAGKEVLRFQRPFSFINSRIRVYDPIEAVAGAQGGYPSSTDLTASDAALEGGAREISPLSLDSMRIIGEAQSQWAPLRRKYNLFVTHNPAAEPDSSADPIISTQPVPTDLSPEQKTQVATQQGAGRQQEPSFFQFAAVDEPFLSWDFSLYSRSASRIGSVNRNFAGFAREIFTDTGVYALRMDAVAMEEEAERRQNSSTVAKMSEAGIGQRAYAEALGAESGAGGMTLDQRAVMLATAVSIDFDYFSRHSHSHAGGLGFTTGGEAARGGGGGAGGVAKGGPADGVVAGAGTMAGYEAMQSGFGRNESDDEASSPPPPDSASPPPPPPPPPPEQQPGEQEGNKEDVWGWGGKDDGNWWGGGDGSGGSGGDGGGDVDW